MIDNSDKIGCYVVTIKAHANMVAGFQCPTEADVVEEVTKIIKDRRERGLPSEVVTVCTLKQHPTRTHRGILSDPIKIEGVTT